GDDAVTFKLARPKPEDRVRVSQSDKAKTTRTTTVGGKKSSVTEQNSSAWVYVGEVVAKGDAPKIKRTYQNYEVLNNGAAEAGPPLNVPILSEPDGAKFTSSAGKPQLPPAFVHR